MAATDMYNCELPSEKYYRELNNYTQGTTYKHFCDSDGYILSGENPISKNSDLKDFIYKFASNIEHLKNKKNENSFDMKKHCTHLQFLLQYNYILDIFNIYNEFEHVCNEANKERCPEYWNEFKNKYSETSDIEYKCKDVYENFGFYKVKMYWGEKGIEKYIEQYESEHIFAFFEKLIGYSIKYYLSKTMHYCKYIVLPIILILLFYFFMKKLSFFGSKISPKADDMRKMWRNVQSVTNPASLLNPMKPPGGGNKMGLPYMPM
ncbi:hypothetical protein POVWA2_077950 [Plasmodium ovale wallikeri]|uniref:PIR Superfamily Protein n=1 Tax=Plasmodium ovale wallikeri TaxID=864142 RepID=A0A1A9AM94_PLAOA|nr:hypothetical protein POVWA2_077950 [Plasmodium ovale wallikeri]SBT57752.1 hypothetical protein POVWA1_083580 [Plasmodium ovale wallikeri]